MSLARTLGVALTGVQGDVIEIEADVADSSLPGLQFTGLADATVVESRDRIRAALTNSGITWPNKRITLALFPADVRKVGSRFDLGMAMALLGAAKQIPADALNGVVWIAELGLDGRLRAVRGVLPSIVAARRAGYRRMVVAAGNAAEAALVPDVDVRAAENLRELLDWFLGLGPAPAPAQRAAEPSLDAPVPDLADVAGQSAAKRALEISAAGHHHLYLVGVPGAGKTMLAERLPGLLPDLDDDAALEVTAVHSVAGRLDAETGLIRRPPLQAPHHTASMAALVGGGSGLARPGAISLAHHGCLFLDEAPEFSASSLDALRQPLEKGQVVLHRSGGVVRYPANFQLLLAANPCPCGARPDDCICTPPVRRRYLQRISGPLLDRIDLRVQVDPVLHAELFETAGERVASGTVAERVASARAAARERWADSGWQLNSQAPGSQLRRGRWALPRTVIRPAEDYLRRGELSVRGLDRVLRVAWTIADLGGRTVPELADVAEALYFRSGASSWAA
ncbi:MAG TPA: YifB family Mg chelatase-like AAA ATPase [Jatrophihabitans sp.]|jgi:magnesium chelatase family protein